MAVEDQLQSFAKTAAGPVPGKAFCLGVAGIAYVPPAILIGTAIRTARPAIAVACGNSVCRTSVITAASPWWKPMASSGWASIFMPSHPPAGGGGQPQ